MKTLRIISVILAAISVCQFARSQAQSNAAPQEPADIIRKTDELNAKAQEEAAKIAVERENLAEREQEQRERVAEDIASRTAAQEAARTANLKRAATEEARREGIVAELKGFIDRLDLERSLGTGIVYLQFGDQWVEPGFTFASPAGYSVTYNKKEGDYFLFTHEEDAFTLKLRKPVGGLATVEMTPKQPLVKGFEVGQTLPDFGSTKRGNLFDGTWVGTINTRKGNREFTLVISGSGTVMSQVRTGGPRKATNDGKTMTWHWGIDNKTVLTFTPNPDCKTAVITLAAPAIRGMNAVDASAIFHRT